MNDNEKNPNSQVIGVGVCKNAPGNSKLLSAAMGGAAAIHAVAAASYADGNVETRTSVHPYNPGSARTHMENRKKRKIANKSKQINLGK